MPIPTPMQMDDVYQHPNIQMFYMKKLKLKKKTEDGAEAEGDVAGDHCDSTAPFKGKDKAAHASEEDLTTSIKSVALQDREAFAR